MTDREALAALLCRTQEWCDGTCPDVEGVVAIHGHHATVLLAAGVSLHSEPLDRLLAAAREMLTHIDAYDDAMGHSYCASQSGEIEDGCTCGFDEKHDRWVAALEGAE